MDKEKVAQILTEIGTLLELKGENPFKTRAYQNAFMHPRFANDVHGIGGEFGPHRDVPQCLARRLQLTRAQCRLHVATIQAVFRSIARS